MSESNTVAFLIVAILGCAFAAFELAGQRLEKWHTISYWASINKWLRWAIILAFFDGGIIGALWFSGHACTGCIER